MIYNNEYSTQHVVSTRWKIRHTGVQRFSTYSVCTARPRRLIVVFLNTLHTLTSKIFWVSGLKNRKSLIPSIATPFPLISTENDTFCRRGLKNSRKATFLIINWQITQLEAFE